MNDPPLPITKRTRGSAEPTEPLRNDASRARAGASGGGRGLSCCLGRPKTEFLPDRSRTIIATNDSPDVGFEVSINPYRGCEHGCIYCYARPTHEYIGFSAGLDFETKILVKHDAPNC